MTRSPQTAHEVQEPNLERPRLYRKEFKNGAVIDHPVFLKPLELLGSPLPARAIPRARRRKRREDRESKQACW